VESCSLPVLEYRIGAINLSKVQLNEINVRWNVAKLLVLTVRNVIEHLYAASAVLILTMYASLTCFKLAKSLYLSSNNVLKTVFSCFVSSRDLTELCMLCGLSVMKVRFNEIRPTHNTHEHFKISSLY